VRDLAVLILHLLATVARLAGPDGARSVVAESVLVKQQLLVLNRSRKRSPHLRLADRIAAGVCTLLMRPAGWRDVRRKIATARLACVDCSYITGFVRLDRGDLECGAIGLSGR
jgi:hypothetical protein